MSLTSTVPSAVPSLVHSPPLLPLKRFVLKNKAPFALTRRNGATPFGGEGRSLTKTVPSAVPSLVHNSAPVTPSLAVKNSFPFTFVRYNGEELDAPAAMSLTRTVPAAVPSLFQSS